MKDLYSFEDEQFRFTGSELQLLRSRFPFKKISFTSISKIAVKRGVRVKYPTRLLIFGLLLTITSLYILIDASGVIKWEFTGDAHKTLGYLIVMSGFLLALGGFAIYHAVFPTWIMRVDYINGSHDVFSLSKLKETNEVYKLTSFLKKNFQAHCIEVDRNLL